MNEAEKDKATIRVALDAARSGGASVSQLAVAHQLAEKHQLPTVTAEMRTHLRNLIPDPQNGALAVGKTVALGVTAGVLTHLFLRAVSLRRIGMT
jgi:hypothetical protein